MKKIPFEEACKIGMDIMSAENFRNLGVMPTVAKWSAALREVGWTSAELSEESERRMKTLIEQKKNETTKI